MMHVLLDLDSTLIYSMYNQEPMDTENYNRVKHLEHHVMDDTYTVFERPHLQEFLDYLFANFRVSIFTASNKNYCLFIVDNFIRKKPGRHIDFIFFSYHCNISKNKYKGNNKRLLMLNRDFELGNAFPMDRMVLIDDLEDWAKDQSDMVINIKPFDVTQPESETDVELVNMITTLSEKKASASVQSTDK